jgi:ribosomal protein S18 acetylase RimI-like enzyme
VSSSSPDASIQVLRCGPERLAAVSAVLGQAFVTEATFAWAFDGPHVTRELLESRLIRAFELYLERLLPLGVVWEASEATRAGAAAPAGDPLGAMVLISDDKYADWEAAVVDDSLVRELTDDGGARHVAFWDWLTARLPDERTWQLDSLGVAAHARGRGVGSALLRHALERATAAGFATTLETATPGNVPIYEHMGFRVYDDALPPAGPRVWFMRKDP